MNPRATRILTQIDETDIRAGDILHIDREGRPATVAVDSIKKGSMAFYNPVSGDASRDGSVEITTSDGAVLLVDLCRPADEQIDELGALHRVSESPSDRLLSDVRDLRDALVNQVKTAPDRGFYDFEEYDEEPDAVEPRMLPALARVLDYSEEALTGIIPPAKAPTASADVVSRILAEVDRERLAMSAVADRLVAARDSPRFPKSRARPFGYAIDFSRESSKGDPSWASEPREYWKATWPSGSHALLAQDWAGRLGLDIDAGHQEPHAQLRAAMESLRALRAPAQIAARLAAEALQVTSITKGLGAEIRSIIAELERIGCGRTSRRLFGELPGDPWQMTADDLASFWNEQTDHGLEPSYPSYRLQRDLHSVADEDALRALLVGWIAAGEIDLEDVPVLLCATIVGSYTPNIYLWPVSREWLHSASDR